MTMSESEMIVKKKHIYFSLAVPHSIFRFHPVIFANHGTRHRSSSWTPEFPSRNKNMTRVLLLPTLAALAAIVFAGNTGQACDPPQGDAKAPPFHCPVVGLPESKSCCCKGGYCPLQPRKELTVEHRGATLQFCCGQCVKMFKVEPAKFALAANHQFVVTKQAKQVKCPLTGETMDPSMVVEIGGVKVAFASEECKKKVANVAPAERVNLVFGEQAFSRGFVMTVGKRQ